MFRKMITALSAILVVFAVAYIYTSSNMLTTLNAQSAPVFQLPKGSKVILGTYNNKEVVWDIGNNNNNGNYVLMSSKPIVDSITVLNKNLPYTSSVKPNDSDKDNYCIKFYQANDSSYAYCPTTPLKDKINDIVLNNTETEILSRNPFLPSVVEVRNGGTLGLTVNDRAFKGISSDGWLDKSYWLDGRVVDEFSFNTVYKDIYMNVIQVGASLTVTETNDIKYDYKDYDTGIRYSEKTEKIFRHPVDNWISSGGTVFY